MTSISKVANEKLKRVVHTLSDSVHDLRVSLFYTERLPSKDKESFYVGAHLVAGNPIRDVKSYTELDIDENRTTAYYPRLGLTFYVNSNQDGSYSIEPGSIQLALFPYSPVTFLRACDHSGCDVIPLSEQSSLLGENVGIEVLEKLKRDDGMSKIERKLRNACQEINNTTTTLMWA